MPAMLERCVQHLMDQGHDQESAYAICNSVMDMMNRPEEDAAPAPVIKGIEEIKEPRRKFFVSEVKALKNGNVEHYITTEAPDRVGDIIRAKGWNIESFKKTGGPVMFGHFPALTPGGEIAQIGNAVEMEIQRKGIWSVTKFHEKTQLSRDAAMLARDGIMKSWSVGFNPLEPPESRTEDGVFKGYIFNKQELLEYSLVPIPANPEAVSKAVYLAEKGLISREVAAIFAGPSPQADKDSAQDAQPIDPEAARAALEDFQTRATLIYFMRKLESAQVRK